MATLQIISGLKLLWMIKNSFKNLFCDMASVISILFLSHLSALNLLLILAFDTYDI